MGFLSMRIKKNMYRPSIWGGGVINCCFETRMAMGTLITYLRPGAGGDGSEISYCFFSTRKALLRKA